MAVYDTATLVMATLYNSMHYYIYYGTESKHYSGQTADTLANVIIHFVLPMYESVVYGSFIVTVMVTVDRYIAVCRPMVVRRRTQVYITVAALTLYALAYHIPIYFEFIIQKYGGLYRDTYYIDEPTQVVRILADDTLHNNLAYQIIYKVIMSVLLRDLGPIILLLGFNIRLYRALRQVRKRYLQMRRGSSKAHTKRHVSSSESLTMTVVMVVTVFAVLISPKLLLKLLNTIRQIAIVMKKYKMAQVLAPVVYNIYYSTLANLLLSCSSSVNFIIYIIFAKKFKKLFIHTFCNWGEMRGKVRDILMMSNTSDAPNNQSSARKH